MKIGILTQPLRSNYGGLLQNYALQKVLIAGGHEVETLDWQYTFNSPRGRRLNWVKTYILSKFNFLWPSWYFLSKDEQDWLTRNIDSFKQKIKKTKMAHDRKALYKSIKKGKYDAFIVGSDQCWRPRYNGPFLGAMFLDFAEGEDTIIKIAYAASFGVDKWELSQQETLMCKKLAKLFNVITVREDSAIMLCEEYLDVRAKLVLDPTMLLDVDDYKQFIREKNDTDEYIVTYILDQSTEKTEWIRKLSSILDTGITEINTKKYDYHKGRGKLSDYEKISVPEWLSKIYYSKVVIVDSFHGLVFSILFNRPFWVLGNEKRGNARLKSLLNMFNLSDRMLSTGENASVDFFTPINWNDVNEKIAKLRQKSKHILYNTLNNAKS